ncbi:MAG: hypothetical protein IJS63_13220, partial [Bacteroidaceae bacterium]|nr:hypothetical protein [Bacteroidaceae bacterium]
INGGYHPRLCSIVSSRLLVSPIPYIIAQMLVHKRKERLCVHFYRTAIKNNYHAVKNDFHGMIYFFHVVIYYFHGVKIVEATLLQHFW